MARRVARPGRVWLAFILVGFVLIAAGVIWRRAAGIQQASEIRSLQQRYLQLDARRSQLESDIRRISARTSLAPVVERHLGMHVPNDTQVVIIPRVQRAQ